jgi:protein ImuB
MLWLALYFPALPLQCLAQGRPQDVPLAVSHRQEGREVIARCNAAATACGVRPGLPLQAALALSGTLQIHARDPGAEQAALHRLAQWAYQFSPQIAFEPSLLLLEIGASLRLFGGLPALLRQVVSQAEQLGYRLHWATAPTPMAAALLARNRPGSRASEDDLAVQLDSVPLASLTRDARARELVTDIGLRTLGECLQLPRPELARRAGPKLMWLFERLLGEIPDPREYWQPPQRFVQKLELLAEIDRHTALLFPARRLLVTLCGFLRGRGAATQRLHWRLLHRDAVATCFEQGLLAPSRDSEHILGLLRERIERVRLPEPVIALELRVDDCLPFAELSGELLGDSLPQADRQLLEQLRSRLGEHRVLGLCQLPDHRPERAWQFCTPGDGEPPVASRVPQPSWLLKEPCPLTLRQGRPDYHGPLQLRSLPRRIESGWWDGFDIARDYFVASSEAGERLWVFRDRRSGQWFLHGFFS